jgi:hypothetical protein
MPRGGHDVYSALFYLSAGLLVVAWFGIGRDARQGRLTTGRAWFLMALWGIPLFVGPPLFSRDIYSYIAQGVIAHGGHDPYRVGPTILGNGPLLSSIASVWRTTVAPYGPLFIAASRGVATVSGHSLVAQVLAFRALELIGVVLIMYALPRLARHLGTDPGMALWLGALSPLALFSYVASGHNDALMIGLLLAGVALALEGRFAVGLVLCALAATIKLPAGVAVVFLAAERLRAVPAERRVGVVAEAVALPVATVAAVTWLSGLGWAWLSGTNLRVPTELRVLSTPAVSLGVFVWHVLRLLHIPVERVTTVNLTQWLCATAAVAAVLALVLWSRRLDVVRVLGIALLLIVLGGPTVWPWYLMWGISLLAATPAQRSRVLALLSAFAMLVVGPGGSPMLSGYAYVVVTLAVLATLAWLVRGGRWRSVVLGPDGGSGSVGELSAVA